MDPRWEAKPGQVLDDIHKVGADANNHGVDFTIPYTFDGEVANHLDDSLGRWSFLEVSDPRDAANLIRAHVRPIGPVGRS
jgi:hypothetical protein